MPCWRSRSQAVTIIQTNKPTKKVTNAAIINRRRNQALDRQDSLNLLLRIALLALCAWVLFSQVFLITRTRGNDMFPAVKDGDLIIGFRLQQEYTKNDVVVYTAGGKTRIGRILARQTDVVTLDDSGNLLINGTTQSGEILYPTYAKEGLEYPYNVPEGHVFILGDYRTQTEDSRDFGPIPMENIKAKVITILRRRGL